MASPRRPDPLKDAEARCRALTREVGTLREDLRREVKRRERAVAQAQEYEEARKAAESRAAELAYSNSKLAGELDALHGAARHAAERDRRALRALREGLAEVEAEVAARAQKGYTQVRLLSEALQQLRSLLFGQPPPSGSGAGSGPSAAAAALLHNVTAVSSSVAPRAEQLLLTAREHAVQLASLLRNDGSSGAEGEEGTSGAAAPGHETHVVSAGAAGAGEFAGGDARSPGRHGRGLGGGADGGLVLDMEKEQLKDEVVRLRAELRLLAERTAGGATMAALELQHSLREAQQEVARLRAEVVHLNATGAARDKEREGLEVALQEARDRLTQQDELHGQLVAAARQHQDSSLGVLAELQSTRVALEGEVSSLTQQLSSLRDQALALAEDKRSLESMLAAREAELSGMKANMMQQGDEIRSALRLIGRPGLPGQASRPMGQSAPPGAGAGALGAPLGSGAPSSFGGGGLDPGLAAALQPYQAASAAIGSALAAAAALAPLPMGSTSGVAASAVGASSAGDRMREHAAGRLSVLGDLNAGHWAGQGAAMGLGPREPTSALGLAGGGSVLGVSGLGAHGLYEEASQARLAAAERALDKGAAYRGLGAAAASSGAVLMPPTAADGGVAYSSAERPSVRWTDPLGAPAGRRPMGRPAQVAAHGNSAWDSDTDTGSSLLFSPRARASAAHPSGRATQQEQGKQGGGREREAAAASARPPSRAAQVEGARMLSHAVRGPLSHGGVGAREAWDAAGASAGGVGNGEGGRGGAGGGGGAGRGGGGRLAALRRDMQSLDAEISQMEASLQQVATRQVR